MIRRTLFICLATYCTMVACNGLTTPPTGPGTSYPCGVWGVTCSISEKGALCCPQNHICGHDGPFNRCEPGMCCYDGDNWPSFAPMDAGAEFDSGKGQSLLPQYKMPIWNRGSGQ